jgi:hypothetical protein
LQGSGKEHFIVDHDVLKNLFRVFDPEEALPAGDPRYVKCYRERGSEQLVNLWARVIHLSAGPSCQLVSGQPGGGKTTELFLLQQSLSAESYFVVYCDAAQEVDLHNLDYPDLLLAIVQCVVRVVRGHSDTFPLPARSFWNELATAVGESAKASAQGLPHQESVSTFDLKRDRSTRYRLREYLRQRATALLEAVNEVLQQAAKAVADRHAGLVVIVDNLDRLPRKVFAGANRTNQEALFVDASEYLRNLSCHVLYTFPAALLSSLVGARLGAIYGNVPLVLPLIPIKTRQGDEDFHGMQKLVEIIHQRWEHADSTNPAGVAQLPSEGAQRLARASGGSPGKLLALTRSALLRVSALPLTYAAIDQAVRDARDFLVLNVGGPRRWEILRQVGQTKEVPPTEDVLELLDNGQILEYRDEQGLWFDVHPLLQEARSYGQE